MPTYEYACRSCGHHLEVSQSFSEEPLTTCPNCGGDLRKVFGSIGIVLKGSGFYRTDSRPASSTKTATQEKKEAAAGSESTSGSAGASSSSATTPASGTPSKSAGTSAPAPASSAAASG